MYDGMLKYHDIVLRYTEAATRLEDVRAARADLLERAAGRPERPAEFKVLAANRDRSLMSQEKDIEDRIEALCGELADLQTKDAGIPRWNDSAQLAHFRAQLRENRVVKTTIEVLARKSKFSGVAEGARAVRLAELENDTSYLVRKIRLLERKKDEAEASAEEFEG